MLERLILKDLLEEASSSKSSIVVGPRQVGKTIVLKQLHKKLGGLFLDIDIYSDYKKVSSYEETLATLRLHGYQEDQKEIFYLFLDEFQRYKDLTMVIKNIYDHHPNIKVYATGSSSLMIKDNVQDSLAGRKFLSHLYPLSFREFLLFKDREDCLQLLDNFNQQAIETKALSDLAPDLLKLLEEFLVYGAYPEVTLVSQKQKKKTLASIFDLYMKKDIRDYLQVSNIDAVKVLLEQLAINNAEQANYSNYGMIAGIDDKTVKNYIGILKETYIINELRPFFRNKAKELSKRPKLYFMDTGLRNFIVNNFSSINLRDDKGALFETYYISELLKHGYDGSSIKYYRTKSQQEIDIVVDQVSTQIPIELKYVQKVKPSHCSSLKAFASEYKSKQVYIVNTAETGQIKGSPSIKLLAPWQMV